MNNKDKVEVALNKDESLADKVKKADNIMSNIDIQMKRKLIQNVTFALTEDDVIRINEQIKRYMHLKGEPLTKSLLIRASLELFSKLDDNELIKAVSSISHIERGRPKIKY